jgi:hypothetical protein
MIKPKFKSKIKPKFKSKIKPKFKIKGQERPLYTGNLKAFT